MTRKLIILLCSLLPFYVLGCDISKDIDTSGNSGGKPDIIEVTVTPLVSGLNYPTSVRIITSDDPYGTGSTSVLDRGNLLVTNAGSAGNYANSIVEVDPRRGEITLFSDSSFTDLEGEPAADRPVGITFPGAYPWVANATWCYGSVSVLDASPGYGFDGPTSRSGEPISGPYNQGVYGCSDFRLTCLSVSPGPDQSDVPLSSQIVVRFSLAVDPSSITENTFSVSLEEVEVPTGMDIVKGVLSGTYHYSADMRTVTFVPDEELVSSTIYESTVYEITLSSDIRDMSGNSFDANLETPEDEEDYVSTFITGIERIPPRIVDVHPANFQHVSTYMAVILTFSEPVRRDSIDEHSFKLIKADYEGYEDFNIISGDKYYYEDNKILAFIPDDSDFVEASRYYIFATGTLPSGFPGIQDRAGNGLDGDGDGSSGGDFWSSFYTMGEDDPPYVIYIAPYRGEANVPVDTTIYAIFSEPVQSESISTGSFLLFWGDEQIYGIVTRSNGYLEATFTPYYDLPYNARIDVILTSEIEDVNGNPLDGNQDGIGGDNFHSWFFTGPDPDDFPPQVAALDPADGTTDVSINTTVTATFSKEIDPLTVTTATFSLWQGVNQVPSSVAVLPGNLVATLTPLSALSYDLLYQVLITDGIEDFGNRQLDGNYDGIPGGNFVSYFTTMPDPAMAPPWVTSVTPTDGATGVPVSSAIVVSFSKAMNTATVATGAGGNFNLFEGATIISGGISWAAGNTIATFTPAVSLTENTTYDLLLIDTMQDTMGFQLDGDHDGTAGGNFSSQFTTAANICLVINELLPDPDTDWYDDGSGTISDANDEWIEVYNCGSAPITLTGYYLTDSNTTIARYTFGVLTLNPDSYVAVYGGEQSSLSLNNGGDTVNLFDDLDGLIDSHTYGATPSDVSVQRIPNGTGNFEDSNSCPAPGGGTTGCPTPGGQNYGAKMNQNPLSQPDWTRSMAAHGAQKADYRPLLTDNWGFGGIAYGGLAPDTPDDYNTQFFTSHPQLNEVFVFDFNSGYYQLGSPISAVIEGPEGLVYIPERDTDTGFSLPGRGLLFILVPNWDTVALVHLIPSGPIGQVNVITAVDQTKPILFFPAAKDPLEPSLLNPIDVVHSEATGKLYIANRGNGSVAEMDPEGHVLRIFKTNLGLETVSGLDAGEWGEGSRIVLSTTGGPTITETSGPYGALYSFPLE